MELRIDNEPEVMDEGLTEGLGLMAAIEKYREFVPDVHFELIPIKDLVIDLRFIAGELLIAVRRDAGVCSDPPAFHSGSRH